MGGGPPDLKGQEFEVPTPASATPPDKPMGIGLTQVTEGQESRGLVRGQGIAPSPLGFSPYACQYASRPHDATFSCASRRPGCRSHAGRERGAPPLPHVGSEPPKGQEGNLPE